LGTSFTGARRGKGKNVKGQNEFFGTLERSRKGGKNDPHERKKQVGEKNIIDTE